MNVNIILFSSDRLRAGIYGNVTEEVEKKKPLLDEARYIQRIHHLFQPNLANSFTEILRKGVSYCLRITNNNTSN